MPIVPQIAQRSLATGLSLNTVQWSSPLTHTGTPLVLVHGLASNARLWDGPARALAALGHPVIAIDQRGHGHSDKTDSGYDMATITDDLATLLEDLRTDGWDRPVVIGQSWGGNVVIELAWKYPALVRGVCGVDGGTIELSEYFPDWNDCKKVMAPPRIAGMKHDTLQAAIAASHSDWSAEAIAGAMSNMERLDDGTIRPWLTFDRHILVLHGLWQHRPSERFGQISVPVMFTPAASSATIDDDMTRNKIAALDLANSQLSSCRVEWFRPADHDLHAQHPQRFADVIHAACSDGFFS